MRVWIVGLAIGYSGVLLGCGSPDDAPAGSSGGAGVGGTGGTTGPGTEGTGGSEASGGMVSNLGWEEVRCFHSDWGLMGCHARIGSAWAVVHPACSAVNHDRLPMNLSSENCGGTDEPTGWDETWCTDRSCWGRRGEWITTLTVECLIEGVPTEERPADVGCDGVSEDPTGWGEVRCYDTGSCYGKLGLYYTDWGLLTTCEVESIVQEYGEITPEEAPAVFCL